MVIPLGVCAVKLSACVVVLAGINHEEFEGNDALVVCEWICVSLAGGFWHIGLRKCLCASIGTLCVWVLGNLETVLPSAGDLMRKMTLT